MTIISLAQRELGIRMTLCALCQGERFNFNLTHLYTYMHEIQQYS